LFPDDSDCGYHEQQTLHPDKKQKKDDGDKHFLRNYPDLIFPNYSEYYSSQGSPSAGRLLMNAAVDTACMRKETKRIMIDAILAEDQRMRRHPGEYSFTDERQTLATCIELIKEYSAMPGYRDYKKIYDEKKYFNEGTLKLGNTEVGYIVGEVIDYVTPSLDLERIIDRFVKAIAIVETYRSKDNFINAWNENIFHNAREYADIRFLYLGWDLKTYIGCDTNLKSKEETAMVTVCEQFNRQQLERFWDKAWNTVRALLLVDCLRTWAFDYRICPYITGPFDFTFTNEN
jgi:hypothetical protein